MFKVKVIGSDRLVEVEKATRLLDVLLALRLPILMACGGKGLCATCHAYIESGLDSTSPVTPRERVSLAMLTDRKSCSRLSCQTKVMGPDIVLSLPKGRYIESSTDIEALIGRRTEVAILDPLSGRVLIEAGMLITRSRIKQLSQVDLDIEKIRSRSASID